MMIYKWTSMNRKPYLIIKAFQIILSLVMLAISIVLFIDWKKDVSSLAMRHSIRLVLGMHCFDIATYLMDIFMVVRRWQFFISGRQVLCSISFTIGFILQLEFYMQDVRNPTKDTNLQHGIDQWILVTIIYIWQTYTIWTVMNLFMYFQAKSQWAETQKEIQRRQSQIERDQEELKKLL